jgi:threonine aldolase
MQRNQPIDLRSDTVTRPSAPMRAAMAGAEVGDDVYGEDPTVHALEARAASLLGTESALFVSSGTQGNLLALLAHCQRGDEYLVGNRMHSYRSEAGGAAVLGGIAPYPIDATPGDARPGVPPVPSVAAFEAAIKPDDFHYARTRLICLENTISGQVLDLDYIDDVAAMARGHGLAVHLDGARLFNAAVKTGISAKRIAKNVDSISVCLSKGLGAPVGSVLCASGELIGQARRLRKMLGGGTRQAGILAAAGLYAFENNVDRLAEDHDNAERLATGLAERLTGCTQASVDMGATQTNMAFVRVDGDQQPALVDALKTQGILISRTNPIRLVTHLDIDSDAIDVVAKAIGDFFQQQG